MNLASANVGQLMIPVDDFDRGVAFYRDVLGLPFLFGSSSVCYRRRRRRNAARRFIFA